MSERPSIALLTDFGTADAYVAAMKGVIIGLAPEARIIDITHAIAPQDVLQGALVLLDVVPYLPPRTICVAVVDPGVGTSRRALALCSAERGLRLIGPDNGLLWPAGGRGALAVHAIEDRAFALPRISSTFHGRDIFAPAAAHLACGVALEQLGAVVTDMVELEVPDPLAQERGLFGQVLRADRFGNLVSNLRALDLPAEVPVGELRFTVGGDEVLGLSATYGEVAPGALLVTEGGFGRLEAAVAGGSAAARLGVNNEMSVPFSVQW